MGISISTAAEVWRYIMNQIYAKRRRVCGLVEPIKNKDQRSLRIWTDEVERSETGRDKSTNTDTHRCSSYMHRAKSEDRRCRVKSVSLP